MATKWTLRHPAARRRLLRGLSEQADRPTPEKPWPTEMPVSAIKRCPELFQPRGWTDEDETHVQALIRALRRNRARGKLLDALLVMYVGPDLYLIDGHHRQAAYEAVGETAPVPVEYFEGTVQEAVRAAGLANHKDRLPMSPEERSNYAWSLIVLDTYSKMEEAEASGVSPRTVASMRAVRKKLGKDADRCVTWLEAQRLGDVTGQEWTEEERQDWQERRVEELIGKIRKAGGTWLARADTSAAAAVLAGLVGRKLPGILEAAGYRRRDGDAD